MHPIFVVILIACAAWFYTCATMAGRGYGARFIFAVLGVVEFFVLVGILEPIISHQDFFRRALRSGPDLVPILFYIVMPALIIIIVSGLWLKKFLRRPAPPVGDQ